MRTHRFIGNFEINKDSFVISDKEIIHQIIRVLHLQKGEAIILVDGELNDIYGIISEINKEFIKGMVIKAEKNESESEVKLTLYLSILKKENFEVVVQKATEIGVFEIRPILTRRTVKTNILASRLEKIAKEAAEQSGRATIPVIGPAIRFEEAIVIAGSNDKNIFFDPEGESLKVSQILGCNKKIGIFVGPEGGWDRDEILLAKKNGFIIINLGKRVLRAETAAIVGSFTVLSCVEN